MLTCCSAAELSGRTRVTWLLTPKAIPSDSTDATGKFVQVDFKTVKPFKTPVTLADIKADPRFAELSLLKQSRLPSLCFDILRPWKLTPEILAFLDTEEARTLALSPPLTADHLIRTKILPAWIGDPAYDDEALLIRQIDTGLQRYAEDYRAYLARHTNRLPAGIEPFEPSPTVVLFPGMGALCVGEDARSAVIARDITAQTFSAKALIAAMGSRYQAPDEEHLFDMEYRPMQQAKLARAGAPPLGGRVALVTGAGGAIGSGISERLLLEGAHVVVTDLPGDSLSQLAESLGRQFPDRVLAIGLDVTDPGSVTDGFAQVSRAWGGVDIVVINAGLAHVSSLEAMEIEKFQQLERVNTHGTLLLLREAARHMKRQGTGGGIRSFDPVHEAIDDAPGRAAGKRPGDPRLVGSGVQQRLLVAFRRAGFGAGQEGRAHLHRLRAQGQGGGDPPPVHDPARSDDRDGYGIDHLRHQGHRADQGVAGRAVEDTAVSTRFRALGDHGIDARAFQSHGVGGACRRSHDEDSAGLQRLHRIVRQ